MKTIKKIILLLTVLVITLIFIPNLSKAATVSASDETSLTEAIQNAQNGDVISLTSNIVLTKPIEITEKNIAINGNGNTISANSENWNAAGANSTLITAGIKATVNLVNLTLTNSPKYGVQAYNGGYVILDNVTIADCKYGGVLANAGTVEVRNLNLKHNGREDSNNGIEIAKSSAISESENNPTLIMNGSLTSTETQNVVYVDVDDPVGKFDIVNTENTVNKVFLNGNKIAITDQNDNIIFLSNEIGDIEITGESYVPNVVVTIKLNDQVISFTLKENETITKEALISRINLESLGLSNYSIDGFFLDETFTTEFDFTKPITQDTTIFAKLSLIQTQTPKDETPKTGIGTNLEMLYLIVAISTVSLIILKRK